MAAPLSQQEIDAILGSTGDIGLPASEPSASTPSGATPKSSGQKFYSSPVAQPYHFRFPYHSPIVKKYILNPGTTDTENSATPVVFSITTYSQKHKK
jgi:hypothetical protein